MSFIICILLALFCVVALGSECIPSRRRYEEAAEEAEVVDV